MTELPRPPSDETVRTATAVHVAVLVAALGGMSVAGMSPSELSTGSWWTPFLVVNGGILAGNLAMLWLSRRPDAALRLLVAGRREDLEDNRRVVVEQLRVLEAEREKLAPDDYARERAELVSVGAQASRELDEAAMPPIDGQATQIGLPAAAFPPAGGPPTAPATSPAHAGPVDALLFRLQVDRDADPDAFHRALARLGYAPRSTGGEWRGAATVLLLVGLVGLLFSFAGDNARDRGEGMGMTGGDQVAPMAGGPAGAPEAAAPSVDDDPRAADYRAALAKDPKDLAALNGLTELALYAQDAQTALQLNDQAMEIAPKDTEARVLRAVLLAFIGQRDRSFQLLDDVLVEQPKHVKGLFFRGVLTMRTDPAQAIGYLERALAEQDRPEIRSALEQAKALAAGGPPPGAEPSAPPAATGAPDASAGGDEVLASGTIALASGARATGKVLFVSLRAPGGGPPMAALKLPPGPFPMAFTLTRANLIPMMAGRPLPAAADVVATLDADGDAFTKDGDPTSKAPEVALGTTGVALELR